MNALFISPLTLPFPLGERDRFKSIVLNQMFDKSTQVFPLFALFVFLVLNYFFSPGLLNASPSGQDNNPPWTVNLVVNGMSEEAEDSGGVIRINADFDEKNKNVQGHPLADYQPDEKKGRRIVEDDPDLLDGSFSIEGESVKGKWRLIFRDNIIIWEKLAKGKYSELISSKFSKETAIPFSCNFKIEGIKGSMAANDAKILVEFIPDGSKQVYRDSVSLTVLETRFALSFDDGPLPDKTDKVVRALKNFHYNGEPVKAAFFQIGAKIHKFGELTRFVDQNGHLVGNHTQYHERYGHETLPDKTIKEDITLCQEEIRKALGKEPLKIIRNRSLWEEERFDRMALEMGYEICHGEMLQDWESPNDPKKVEEKAEQVLAAWNTRDNPQLHPYPAILIFHEFPEVTCDHIGEIVRYLQDRGFVLVDFDPNQIY
ncbi:MAG TPA: polysaccharide deacetylase family protein [candidate division Zixibacteria bacterium]